MVSPSTGGRSGLRVIHRLPPWSRERPANIRPAVGRRAGGVDQSGLVGIQSGWPGDATTSGSAGRFGDGRVAQAAGRRKECVKVKAGGMWTRNTYRTL